MAEKDALLAGQLAMQSGEIALQRCHPALQTGEKTLRVREVALQRGEIAVRTGQTTVQVGGIEVRSVRVTLHDGEVAMRLGQAALRFGEKALQDCQPAPRVGEKALQACQAALRLGERAVRLCHLAARRGQKAPRPGQVTMQAGKGALRLREMTERRDHFALQERERALQLRQVTWCGGQMTTRSDQVPMRLGHTTPRSCQMALSRGEEALRSGQLALSRGEKAMRIDQKALRSGQEALRSGRGRGRAANRFCAACCREEVLVDVGVRGERRTCRAHTCAYEVHCAYNHWIGETRIMQLRTKQGLKTLRQAHAFLSTRAYSAAVGDLKPQVDALAAIVQRLDARATDQQTSKSTARAATDAKRALAHTLRMEYMRPITRLARRLFADDAEVRKVFTDTPPRDDEGLIQAASSFVELGAKHRERFVEKGLASDFVERLEKTLSDFRQVLVARGLEQARRASATVALMEELARGRDQVRLVDAMLAPRLASRPEQLAEWRSIARFVRQGGADDAAEVPTTGEVPEAPAAAAPADGGASDSLDTPARAA